MRIQKVNPLIPHPSKIQPGVSGYCIFCQTKPGRPSKSLGVGVAEIQEPLTSDIT